MAIRNIRYYDDPILRKRCKEVKVINDKVRQILDDMLDTLQQTENGAAIAANQIGILKRLVVIDYDDCHVSTVGSRELAALVGQNGANRGIWESRVLRFYYE